MALDFSAYRVKRIVFPSNGERHVIVEGPPDGIALEGTSIYTSMKLREQGMSPNSMAQHLAAIVLLLKWADRQDPPINLDQRLQSVQLLSNDEILSLRKSLRRNLRADRLTDPQKKSDSKPTVSHGHYYFRCHAVRDYVVWHAQRSVDRIQSRDINRLREMRLRLDNFVERMTGDLPSPRERSREGVSENIQQIFLDAIVPGSPTNPFQKQHQVRNYALLLLYHEHGLRKADPLKVRGEDLHLHGEQPMIDIKVRQDETIDPRRNEPRHKTFGRPLPLGSRAAEALKNWVLVERPKYPGSKRSPFVFLARTGVPLSLASVDDMFRLIRERVPGIPPDFTAHISRHNAADRFSAVARALGWSDAEKRQIMNFQFGWSKTSTQGDRYQLRTIKEGAQNASLLMQIASTEGADE